jgi:hypothetical protein
VKDFPPAFDSYAAANHSRVNWLNNIFKHSSLSATHEVTDDSGFLAIVDPDAYQGFIREDWTLDLLLEWFASEMAARHLLIWGTGLEKIWEIHASFQPTGVSGFREISGSIASSRGRLLLTNYESLTMAAQFADTSLPQSHERSNLLQVQPVLYDCRIVQLSDPDTEAPFEEKVSFIYEFTPTAQAKEAWSAIPWRTE